MSRRQAVSDQQYFYEKDMTKTNLVTFCSRLPSHLQEIFKASLHASMNSMNVLQGYRGPSYMCIGLTRDSAELEESDGLQEIRHRWALMQPFYSRVEAEGRAAWSSLYFDVITGECLSHIRDEAVARLTARASLWHVVVLEMKPRYSFRTRVGSEWLEG